MKSPKPNLQDQIAVLNRRIAEFERRDQEQQILLKGAVQKGGELLGQVKELTELLRRAKAVIPDEFEDEIEVRAAITRYLNAHQG